VQARDPASASELAISRKTIIEYYRDTWLDYRILWLNRENLAYHFGYYDDDRVDHERSLIRSNEILAKIVGVRASDLVLDAGCGIGGSSFWLARAYATRAVGIALGETQLQTASRLARTKMLSDRVSFVCADFTVCPFADGTFDVIWAQESLCHAPQKPAFYREAARLLRPGGRLVAAEFMRARRNMADKDKRLLRKWLDGWAIPDLDTADEHIRAAADAGLAQIEAQDVTDRTMRSLRRLSRWARVVAPFEYPLYWLGLRNAVQHGNVVGAFRQFQALQRRLWRYVILSASKP
jgi:cyclopropane fatty-acyl-phospholipid synthase-like methyltransferase